MTPATSAVALDLTWTDTDVHIAALAERIRRDDVPEIIIGILRGGMVPAIMLAHHLGVRDVRGIEVTHTMTDEPNGAKTPHPLVVNPASVGALNAAADVLVVDDVAGSGDTLDTTVALLDPHVARVRRAVLVVNTLNWGCSNKLAAPHDAQDYIGTTCAGWVRFPWEVR